MQQENARLQNDIGGGPYNEQETLIMRCLIWMDVAYFTCGPLILPPIAEQILPKSIVDFRILLYSTHVQNWLLDR